MTGVPLPENIMYDSEQPQKTEEEKQSIPDKSTESIISQDKESFWDDMKTINKCSQIYRVLMPQARASESFSGDMFYPRVQPDISGYFRILAAFIGTERGDFVLRRGLAGLAERVQLSRGTGPLSKEMKVERYGVQDGDRKPCRMILQVAVLASTRGLDP
ncbi:hypothetical protein CEK25_013447 [Fusarium fujikuroi]|nr:hypothetical protein CEK25_013447 [Fusarium fujikuroi]